MSRNVFRPQEVALTENTVSLEPPFKEPEPEIADVELDSYTGPTADELRREAEEWKRDWETEKAAMIGAAKAEADALVERAKAEVSSIAEGAAAEKERLRAEAAGEAEKIRADAETAAAALNEGAQSAFDAAREAAAAEGRNAGHDDGFKAGQEEVARLIERCEVILARIQDERKNILDEAEKQIVELCLLVTRKVVKSIAETHKETLILNIKEALGKVKTKGKVIVKVNITDLGLATEHKKDFLERFEAGGDLEIHEDSSVDRGGCVIETDYGEIDARIASQLGEMEAKILELTPIRTH